MALKIIQKGKKASDRKWSGSCRQCGSVAECLQSDINHHQFDQREQSEFSWEICPECGAGGSMQGYGGLLMYPVK